MDSNLVRWLEAKDERRKHCQRQWVNRDKKIRENSVLEKYSFRLLYRKEILINQVQIWKSERYEDYCFIG